MKIIHIGLSSHYTENMMYQDNMLSAYNAKDGHAVLFVSDTAKFEGGVLVDCPPGKIQIEKNLYLLRLPYTRIVNSWISKKIKKVKNIREILEEFLPDVIFSHSLCYWSVLDVVRYKKDHPNVKFYADTHADANNSATNWISRTVLHRMFYKYLVQKAVPHLETYFYLSQEAKTFLIQNYGVPEGIMEFYPLGGIIPDAKAYQQARICRREELNVREDELLLVHSGKLDEKKRTADLLRAFAAAPELNAKLIILGSIPDEQKELLNALISADNRVAYLGWKSADDLREYLCACDLYCQPGSQSATMQNAVCCGCPVLLYPHRSYTAGFDYGNILWCETQSDMEAAFHKIAHGAIQLDALKENSEKCARELLDYRKLAARLYR